MKIIRVHAEAGLLFLNFSFPSVARRCQQVRPSEFERAAWRFVCKVVTRIYIVPGIAARLGALLLSVKPRCRVIAECAAVGIAHCSQARRCSTCCSSLWTPPRGTARKLGDRPVLFSDQRRSPLVPNRPHLDSVLLSVVLFLLWPSLSPLLSLALVVAV